ncbi:MAG: DMT family transporter [Verrucomicrobia bacterium]|nr:DMT family transporter [Verrucomicrobiota bacterium]
MSNGLLSGFAGVAAFSLTLPATRVAVQELPPIFVASGRAAAAALLGALCLLLAGARRPQGRQWLSVSIVALALGILFPLCASYGARDASATHGAVILGLLPLFTTLAGMVRVGERPQPLFWVAAFLGSGAVIAFALWENGGGSLTRTDLILLAAAVIASFGYAEAARIAPQLGSWQVVCWALLLVLPVNLLSSFLHQPTGPVSAQAWGSLAYVTTMSQLFGVMLWTRGLRLGGVARVGQLQLLMPFLTFAAAALWLGEALSFATLLAATVVLASIVLSQRARVVRQNAS